MKTQKILGLSLIAFSIAVASCKDKDEVELTKAELAQKTWKVSNATTTTSAGTVSFYSTIPACSKDDLMILRANGIGEYNEGATKCDPLNPQIDPITWSLTTNDTKIVIDGDPANIDVLNRTTLQVSYDYSSAGVIYKESVTYTAQ